jgi:hypothetical protein
VDLEFVQALLPPQWQQSIAQLHISGQARVEQLVFDRAKMTASELRLAELRFCAPIETDPLIKPDQRFAQLTDGTAVLTYAAADSAGADERQAARGDIRLSLSGRLHDAPLELSLALLDAGYSGWRKGGATEPVETLGIGGLQADRYEISVQAKGLTVPNVADHPRFATSKKLPGPLRSIFRKYNVKGRVNLQLAVSAKAAATTNVEELPEATTLRYRGAVEVLGASARYRGFPYPVRNTRGTVRFSSEDGIRFDGLHCRHGAARLRMDGHVVDTTTSTGFDLIFHAENVPADTDLYAALPPKYRQLWDDAAPVGLYDARTVVRRAHGADETNPHETEVSVDARLLAGSMVLSGRAQLDGVNGAAHIEGGRIELEDLQGYLDGAAVRLDGALELAEQDTPQYTMHVEVADVQFDHVSPVRGSQQQPIGEIRLAGVGDVWGQLSSGEQAQQHYAVRIDDGTLTGVDPNTPWTQTRGWICLHGDEQRICSLRAQRDDGWLLTPSGQAAGRGLIRSHRLWETYLCNVMGYCDANAHRHAHRFEHVTGSDVQQRLSEATGHPDRDPSQRPIPPLPERKEGKP